MSWLKWRAPRARLFVCVAASAGLHVFLVWWLSMPAANPENRYTSSRLQRPALRAEVRYRSTTKVAVTAPPAETSPSPSRGSTETQGDDSHAESKNPSAQPNTNGVVVLGKYYLPPTSLTEPPHTLSPVELEIPESRRVSGRLLLRIFLNTEGGVDRVQVLENNLDDATVADVIEKFGTASYSTPRNHQGSVNSWLDVEVSIGLDSSPAVP